MMRLMSKLFFIVAALVWCAVPSFGAELLLAKNGVPKLSIILSAKASDDIKAVAKELAGYLKRITGATFAIETGDGHTGIVLGTLAEFPDDALTQLLLIRNDFDGREAYAIRTESARLRLIGATDLGASHAAFRLLESMGCRWFFPNEVWEVVPSIGSLKVEVNETDRPVILSRRIWYGWGFFSEKEKPNKPHADYQAWARHNRMAASLPINAGHAWQDIIANNKKMFDAHPEYLALTKGKRQGEQLCVSNPAVRQLAVEHVLNQFKHRPGLEMASMECSDGGGQCECEECEKLGSISDRVFGLANEVARAVAAKYPGKKVGLYAYNEHCEPPGFDLAPNVYVQLTAGFTTGKYTFDELLELWPRRCQSLGYYDYFSVWTWTQDRLPGGRGADVPYIMQQIPRYAEHHATSIDAESGNNWGPHGRGYYLANRLLWNPKGDANAILADFYDKAFGPAAGAMKRYYELLDPARPRVRAADAPVADTLFSRHLIGLAYREMEQATQLAKDRPDVQLRLDALKEYLRYDQLCWLRDHENGKEKKKALALAVITHSYRIRYSYMTHWQAMLQEGTPKFAKQFDEPAWSVHDKTMRKAWADDRSLTHDEIERDFAEGLAYFQTQEVNERKFSLDLVPAHFANAPAAISSQGYQGGLRYALYSRDGEDLSVTITAGTIAWYRNHAAARYTLRNSAGEVVTEARMPLDGEGHKLDFKVPKAGLYWFDFEDSAAGWKIVVDAGRPVSVLLNADKGYAHAGHMQQVYFYVPKGTKRIDYYWKGAPHLLIGPDGKQVAEVKTSGEFVRIEVPAGADGKLWSFKQLALGHLWFFNVPNELSASPGALLLPREVVEKDGI